MILDFKYTIDTVTERIISESGGLRKYLLPIIKKNKVADILSAFSMVLFERFYNEKLLPKKNRYNIDESSEEYLKYNIWELGHDLTEGSKYTGSKEYLKRQAKTLSARILKKNTRPSYLYLFYVYGFKYNYSYKGDVINNSNIITNIKEGVDNISIGATVYGEGIQEDTFVISKNVEPNGIGFVELSKVIKLRNEGNILGYNLIYSFYNEDIDSLIFNSFPIKSLETLKGRTISDYVTVSNFSLDYEISKEGVTLDITDILPSEYQDLNFYSNQDTPQISKLDNRYYINYKSLSLDANESLRIVDSNGNPIDIFTPNLRMWNLDNEDISQVTTRHFLLNYILNSVETDSDFLTEESSDAFYNDVLQLKRRIEVPHFEPKLNIIFPIGTLPPNPLNTTKYPNLYTFTSIQNNISYTREIGKINDVALMTTVCFSDNLSDITHIQFGTGKRTDLNLITIETMDSELNSGEFISVNTKFENQDLFLNSVEVSEKNKYRFINPLNYAGYTELFEGDNIPDLSIEELAIVDDGRITEDLPYYEINENNRWSFPIEYFKIEKINLSQLILRNYLFPYFKWSAFSEISFLKKSADGIYETLMYCSFPKINYSQKMLGSIYLNIFLQSNFEESDRKVVFTFISEDWELQNNYKYLYIPYANLTYTEDSSFEYINSGINSSNNANYFFQNIGYNPTVYIFKITDLGEYEQVDVDEVFLANGNLTIKINNTNSILEPFSGKIILI